MNAGSLEQVVNHARKTGRFLKESLPFWLPEIAASALLVLGQDRIFSDNTVGVGEFIRLSREHPYIIKSGINMVLNGSAYTFTESVLNRRAVNKGALIASMTYGAVSGVIEHNAFNGIARLIPGRDFASALGRTLLFNPGYVIGFHVPAYLTSLELGRACSGGWGEVKQFFSDFTTKENLKSLHRKAWGINRSISKMLYPMQGYVMGYAPLELKVTLGNLVGGFAKVYLAYRASREEPSNLTPRR